MLLTIFLFYLTLAHWPLQIKSEGISKATLYCSGHPSIRPLSLDTLKWVKQYFNNKKWKLEKMAWYWGVTRTTLAPRSLHSLWKVAQHNNIFYFSYYMFPYFYFYLHSKFKHSKYHHLDIIIMVETWRHWQEER